MRAVILRVIGILGPIVAMAILRTDRRIIRRLARSGATDADQATAIRADHPLVGWRLRKLVQAGAVAAPAPGRYYLVESGWRAYRARRRRRALTMVAVVVAAVFMMLWWVNDND